MVLKEEAVSRVRVDLEPSLGRETGYQVAVLRQDHGVAVAVRNQRSASNSAWASSSIGASSSEGERLSMAAMSSRENLRPRAAATVAI